MLPDSISMKHAKWCAYALLLLAPGSFLVLPVLWAVRTYRAGRRSNHRAACS